MFRATWPSPKSRSVGLFTDLRLFYEAMELAHELGKVSHEELEEELPQRLQGMLYVDKQSSRAARDIMRELKDFGWITPIGVNGRRVSESTEYILTDAGITTLGYYKKDKRRFLRALTTAMHRLYTIPGWFVHRLWTINTHRQGEVVIPIPPRDWTPVSRHWDDRDWTSDLSLQTRKSLLLINDVCPGALPIGEQEWVSQVAIAWARLSNLKPRTAPAQTSEMTRKKAKYTPRRRLALAMKEAAVKYLFSNTPPNSDREDFGTVKPPLAPRTYMGWCPRLEALELIYYTDAHPLVPGRLLFPTSVFRTETEPGRFDPAGHVTEPSGKALWLHAPDWPIIRSDFLKTLVREHMRVYVRVGSLYVSILDVRDEVCRQLRISAASFDQYMERALRESVLPDAKWSISVETDVREDQRSAPQRYRRPAWIFGTPHSLVAITDTIPVVR